jgi:hypothetical protein
LSLLEILETTNQLFEAGIAITAISLFIRALTFNLTDRVARAFAVILACVTVSFSGEAVSGAAQSPASIEIWLQFQWIGTIFLPAAFMHFADALLETTGKPSRGRRRLLVRMAYLTSGIFLLALPSILVGPLVLDNVAIPHLSRTAISSLFSAYYVILIVLAANTIWRARKRTLLIPSRNRMSLLYTGSLGLAIGSYPFLLIGSGFAEGFPEIFLSLAALGNVLVFVSLIALAYTTAFFGVAWPDRVIRTRLFKWLLRGPATVFVVLIIIPFVNRASSFLNTAETIALPILIALSVLIIQHLITLLAPVWERWIFATSEDDDVRLLQSLQDRVLSSNDLRQFLQAILAAACDRLQSPSAFVASLAGEQVDLFVEVGGAQILEEDNLSGEISRILNEKSEQPSIFAWADYFVIPLRGPNANEIVGLLGVMRNNQTELSQADQDALNFLGAKAALALEDRNRQRELMASLEELSPSVREVQLLRASSRYDQRELLKDPADLSDRELSKYVRDALNHYWGGPNLTQSPLRGLQIVQRALEQQGGNPANAMRAILKQAIERNRPKGEPALNTEWLLYNLLEMKFLQGRKVRDVATRLAMSEADLYRKQRVAIESVAESLLEMEKQSAGNDA